jgi:hypothetical protein
MRDRLPRSARITLTTVKVATAAVIGVVGLVNTPHDVPSAQQPGVTGYAVADRPSPADRMLDAHDCSVSGFADEQPVSAIVRAADGRLRFVDFETGWQVYTQHGAATLVAVCLDDPPAQS